MHLPVQAVSKGKPLAVMIPSDAIDGNPRNRREIPANEEMLADADETFEALSSLTCTSQSAILLP